MDRQTLRVWVHRYIDAFLRPTVNEACQQIGEIDLRVDAIELAEQRRQACASKRPNANP